MIYNEKVLTSFISMLIGNVPLALQLTKELLEIIPTHARAMGNLKYYEEAIAKTEQEKKKGEDESETVVTTEVSGFIFKLFSILVL